MANLHKAPKPNGDEYHSPKPLRFSFYLFLIVQLLTGDAFAQQTVAGKVLNSRNREPVPFANLVVEGTNRGTTTDINGLFELTDAPQGYFRLVVSSIGYKTTVSEDIYIAKERKAFIEILMEPVVKDLMEIEVRAPQFVKKEESPVSLQTIGIREIERSPGGNRDISKVIQSLPGVASTASFRNDIIIRGGSPSENRFYLDGIEIPVINHFQTQGSSGGPVGIINVNFIREVDFYSGAFPVSRSNALSSVMEFKQVEGNREKHGLRFALGSSDAGLTADGPLSKKTTYILSARVSYLQFLFSALRLPFLPTFTDVQFRVRHRFDEKHELNIIGLGAYDRFRLNLSVNEKITDEQTLERNDYILGNIAFNDQWNYTTGISYRYFGKKMTSSVFLSRDVLNNGAYKYLNNDDSRPENQILDYESRETGNRFRYEASINSGSTKVLAGGSVENASYLLEGFDYQRTATGAVIRPLGSEFSMFKYGLFGSVSRPLFRNRLMVALGARLDGSDYSKEMSNPLDQFSPRLSLSWSLDEKWSLNANTGRYFQIPAYTILGYGNKNDGLINRRNKVTYIRADHLVGGVQYNPDASSKISLEGFYKKYDRYPFSLNDSISLANLGSDFGVVGNEAVVSISKGRAYGSELLLQRRSPDGIYGIVALTLVRSEFTGSDDTYIPSAWDNEWLLTLTGGKKLHRNWEAGLRWRYVSGRPYTPYNVVASSLRSNWDVTGRGLSDYTRLNSERLPAFHQLDIRIDKSYFRKKMTVNLYVDIQNVYNFKARERDILNVRKDENGKPVVDASDPSRYEIYFIKDESGTVLPTVGIIVDF